MEWVPDLVGDGGHWVEEDKPYDGPPLVDEQDELDALLDEVAAWLRGESEL